MDRFNYYRTGDRANDTQLLGVFSEGNFYRFSLETFHLHEIPVTAQDYHHAHSHDVYHLVLYHLGGTMSLNHQVLDTRPGTLVWTSPGEYHSFATTGKTRAAYHELTFRLSYGETPLKIPFHELLSSYFGTTFELPERPLVLSEEQYQRLGISYEATAEALKRRQTGLHARILELLTTFVDIIRTEYTPATVMDERLRHASQLLSRNLRKTLQLADIAAQVSMSKEYFCREFTRCYGLAPMQFRRNHRITLAAQMLRYSDKPLKEIASELGFSDIQHLSHAFKEYSGLSPHRFRQESHEQ